MPRTPRQKTCRRCRSRHHGVLFPHGGRYCRRCHRSLWHWRHRERRNRRARQLHRQRKREAGYARRIRERHLRSKYGLTTERYKRMLRAQGGRCAICRKSSRKTALVVDHKHGTTPPFVRGLACHRCNHLLGHAYESVEVLKSAIRYLRRWERELRKRRKR